MARILIIEDDNVLRFTLSDFLKESNHEVVEASNGEEGLRYFREAPSDIVITDIFMPVKEGLSTIKEIRADNPDCKIIAMTGGGKTNFGNDLCIDVLEAAKKLGALQTFKKPFRFSKMADTINELINM